MRDATWILVLALGIATTSGCVSSSRPTAPSVYGYRVATARVDPVTLDRAPRVLFRGGWAHYVDGIWYYQTESGWVAFVDVPAELQRQADTLNTEQPPTNAAVPRGPTTQQWPIGGGPQAPPPPKVRGPGQ
jgi:hypothetical protein